MSQYFHGGICRIQYPGSSVRITFSSGADKVFPANDLEGIESFLTEQSPSNDFALNMLLRIQEHLEVSGMFKRMF